MKSAHIFNKEDEANDQQCFQCGKGGTLNCCDTCEKSFHQKCKPLTKNKGEKVWSCYYCSQPRCCQFCNVNAKDTLFARCTICHVMSHKSCITSYLDISSELMGGTLLKEHTYVCRGCLQRYGISSIEKYGRVCKLAKLDVEEENFALVHINHRSPIHFGFFKEKDIQEAFDIQIKHIKKTIRIIYPLVKVARVEKVLQIKASKKYEGLDDSSLVEALYQQKKQIGSTENFKFLIKWQGMGYQQCTWEDQSLLKQLDERNHYLNYLNEFIKKRQMHILSLPQIDKTLNLWNGFIDQERFAKMVKFNMMFSLAFIEDGGNYTRLVRDLCYLLNYCYLIEGRKDTSIIVVNKDCWTMWKNELQQNCPQLNVVYLQGSQTQIGAIKQKLVGKFKRQVFLITFYYAAKHQDFIVSKVKSLSLTIIDSLSFSKGKVSKSLKAITQNTIVLQLGKLSKSELLSLSQPYRNQYMIRHNTDWSRIEVIPPHCNAFDAREIVTMINIKEQKRLAIIRFILRFGLPVQGISQLYSILHRFQPAVFNLPTLSEENILLFKNYIKSLLTLASLHSQIKINPNVIRHYFSIVDPQQILKRIAQMHRIREVAKQMNEIDLGETVILNNTGEIMGLFNGWKKDDDIILVNLVLQYGYDNWKQLLISRNWKTYSTLSKGLLQSNYLNFIDYIKMKCVVQFKGKVGNLSEFIQRRLQLIQKAYDSL